MWQKDNFPQHRYCLTFFLWAYPPTNRGWWDYKQTMDTLQGCPEGKLECDWGEVAITNGASLSRSLFGVEYIFYPIIKENNQFLLSYSREGNCLLVLQSTYSFLSQSHFLISFQTYSYHRSNHKTLRTLSVPRARLLQQCGSFLAFHSIIMTSRKVTVSVLPSWGQFFCWHIPRPNQNVPN